VGVGASTLTREGARQAQKLRYRPCFGVDVSPERLACDACDAPTPASARLVQSFLRAAVAPAPARDTAGAGVRRAGRSRPATPRTLRGQPRAPWPSPSAAAGTA